MANTREVTSFLVWAHTKEKKIRKRGKPKKNRKRKIQKNPKEKKEKKRKEFVFSSPGQKMRILSLPYS